MFYKTCHILVRYNYIVSPIDSLFPTSMTRTLLFLILLFTWSISIGQISSQPKDINLCFKDTGYFKINKLSNFSFQWQDSSSAGWGNLTNSLVYSGVSKDSLSIRGASTSLSNRKYRCLVDSSGNAKDTSKSALLIVYPQLVKPSIDSSQSICYNTVPGLLTRTAAATGADGVFTYQWQSSSNGTTYANVSGQTGATYLPPTLTSSTYYRTIASSTYGCGSIASDSVFIEVYPIIKSGVIGTAQSICYNTTPGTLSFSTNPSGGGSSYSYQWQVSTDSITFNSVTGANANTYSAGTLIANRFYRSIVTSSLGCGSDTTNIIKIEVYAPFVAASIGTSDSTCFGFAADTVKTISLPTGGNRTYSYQWLESTNGTSWSLIAGQTNNFYLPGVLPSSKYYKMISSSGQSCGSDSSNAVFKTRLPQLIKPTIDSSQSICYNTVPGLLTRTAAATGADGVFTYQWQSSSNGTTYANVSGQTGATYLPPTLTSSTYYRTIASSTYGCGSIASDSVFIEVYPIIKSGVIGTAQSICYNTTPGTLSFSTNPSGGGSSYSYQWQVSTNNVSFTSISGATSNTYTPGVLIANRFYNLIVTSTYGCGSDTSNSIQITVYAPFVTATIGSSDSTCFGFTADTVSTTVIATGGNGTYTYQWLSSANSTSWNLIAGQANNFYLPGVLPSSKYYKMISSSGQSCGSDSSNAVFKKVLVLPDTVPIIGKLIVCSNESDVEYFIERLQPGISYTWNLKNGGIQTGKWGSKIYVEWNDSGQDYDTVKVIQLDTVRDCFNEMRMPVEISFNKSPNRPEIVKKSTSNILVCSNNNPNAFYQWGKTLRANNMNVEYENANFQYVNLPEPFDTSLFNYWVDVWYNYDEITCPSRGYINPPFWLTSVRKMVDSSRKVILFPNPANSQFSISGISKYKLCDIKIYNGLGKLVLESRIGEHDASIDITALNHGLFFVHTYSNSQLLSIEKLIKK